MIVPLARPHHSFAAARLREPVTFGVPLPRGAVSTPGSWILETPWGARQAEVTVLDRWGDGSVRWMLVDGQIDGSPDTPPDETINLRQSGAAELPPSIPGIEVEEGPGFVTVDTGRVRVTLRSGERLPFAAVEASGRPCIDATQGGLSITDQSGTVAAVTANQVIVEHRGLLRVSICVHGGVTLAGSRRVAVTARLDFYAGHETVRVRCTIRNPDRARHPGNYWDLGDPGSVLIKDVSLSLALPSPAGAPAVSISPESSEPARAVPLPLELYQDSSGGDNWQSTNHINRHRQVPNTFRGYRLRAGGTTTTGDRATPLLMAASGETAVAAVVPAFWQNFPRAVEADARAIHIRFLPGQYADLHELQGGEQKTHECFVAFGQEATAEGLEWCRTPSLVCAAPEWVCASGAVDGLAPLDPGHAALVNQAIEGPDSFEHKREIIDQFGWRHYGEIYGDHEAVGHTGATPLVSHYNNQYDPVLGFGLQFLRTGDARWRRAMDELAGHVIDIDVYHTDSDKSAYNGGLFWHTYHYGDADTATHRTYPRRNNGKVFGGGPSADHNYPSGLVLHFFLGGDVASRDAAIGLAEYVLHLEDWRLTPFRFLSHADTGRAIYTPPGYYGPSRSSGNSLNALIDGHRLTGDARFLEKADQLVQRVVHPREDPAGNRLDEPEFRWFYAMFLQALGKYLAHKAERRLFDEAYAHGRASLLNYARWMAEHEYPYLEKPEKLEFPTETWAAQDIRKSDILYHAAMHTAGDERTRFVERAAYFHRISIETLERAATRALARPVIVLLTSGFLHSWFHAHADASLPGPTGETEFGEPVRFVSQRTLAERRAKVIVLAGGLAAMAGVAALIAWLL